MYRDKKIGLVIPCFKVKSTINNVIKSIPNFVDNIYTVSDNCPEKSVELIKSKSKKIKKIYRKKNGGVGAAVKDGYVKSIKDGNYLTVRIDGDGQMDLALIRNFIDPIISNKSEFTKGNRFLDYSFLKSMPLIRIIGNIFFSFIGNVIIKNFKIFDFLNGYTAIKNDVLRKVLKTDLDDDFFFDTILIYQLNKLRFKILDVPMEAKYENEKSNINVLKTGVIFLLKNLFFIIGIKR